jgi:hypothetical protein
MAGLKFGSSSAGSTSASVTVHYDFSARMDLGDRGDWTPLDFFVDGVRGLKVGLPGLFGRLPEGHRAAT